MSKRSGKSKHCRKKGPGRRHYQGPGRAARGKPPKHLDGSLK